MVEAWIQLQCPNCGEGWEDGPTDLPGPDADHTCRHCGESRRVAEFMRTQRDLEILEEFH